MIKNVFSNDTIVSKWIGVDEIVLPYIDKTSLSRFKIAVIAHSFVEDFEKKLFWFNGFFVSHVSIKVYNNFNCEIFYYYCFSKIIDQLNKTYMIENNHDHWTKMTVCREYEE